MDLQKKKKKKKGKNPQEPTEQNKILVLANHGKLVR